jgi:hypothetical protein
MNAGRLSVDRLKKKEPEKEERRKVILLERK